MLIVLRILGILLIVISLLLLIAVPVAGVIGILLGILCIVGSIKKLKNRAKSELEEQRLKEAALKEKIAEMSEHRDQSLIENRKKQELEKQVTIQPTVSPVRYTEREIPDDSPEALAIKARSKMSKKDRALEDRKRKESMGLTMYEWSTCCDERVCDACKVMEGKICKWADPTVYSTNGKTWKPRPKGATLSHPGEEDECRCTSLSYEKELFGEI